MFLDEPTSGLDAAIALDVVHAARALADGGRAVLVTIHQPSAAAFALFDSLLLLNRGRSVYFGAAHHAARHFGELPLGMAPFAPDEPGANAADYVVQAAAGGVLADADEASPAARAETARALAEAYRRSPLREPFGARNYRSAVMTDAVLSGVDCDDEDEDDGGGDDDEDDELEEVHVEVLA